MSTLNERIDKVQAALVNVDTRPTSYITHREMAAAFDALKDKPGPAPIKLEAGCKVRIGDEGVNGTVVAISRGSVWVDFGDYRWSFRCSHLTVVEAATPEIGDTVFVTDRMAGEMTGMICRVPEKPRDTTYSICAFAVVRTGYPREDFTILHKAPTPGE